MGQRDRTGIRATIVGYALAALLPLLILLPGASATHFLDRDEPRYVGVARTMVTTGDWIVPYFNGQFRFQKPVLTYWLIVLTDGLPVAKELSARMLPAMCLVLSCLLVAFTGNRLYGQAVGLHAALTLPLCAVVYFLGKLVIPDAPQFLGATAVVCLVAGYRGGLLRGSRLVPWLGIAVAWCVLAKGPIVPGMLAVALVIEASLAKLLRWRDLAIWAAALGIAGLLASPWLWGIHTIVGTAFWNESVGNQLAGRVTRSFDGQFLPPGYYPITILLGFAPWSLIFFIGLFLYQRDWKNNPVERWLVSWVFGCTVLVECFRSKQPHYVAPAYPALALLTIVWASRLAKGGPLQSRLSVSPFVNHFIVHGSAVVFPALFLIAFFFGPLPLATAFLAIAGITALFAMGEIFWLYRVRSLSSILARFGARIALVLFLISFILLPAFDRHRLGHQMAYDFQRLRNTHDRLLLYRRLEPSLTYYLNEAVDDFSQLDAFLARVHATGNHAFSILTDDERTKPIWEPYGHWTVIKRYDGYLRMHRQVYALVRWTPANSSGSPGSFEIADNADATPPVR